MIAIFRESANGKKYSALESCNFKSDDPKLRKKYREVLIEASQEVITNHTIRAKLRPQVQVQIAAKIRWYKN